MISTPNRRLATSLILFAFAGCGDPSKVVDTMPRKAVSGSVTLDGKLMAHGQIQFNPAAGSQAPATTVVAEIKDGQYAVEKATGPVPGNYTVAISSRAPYVIAPGQEPGSRPKEEPEKVPAKYNTNSTLTKEITDESVQIVDFDLKSN